LGEKEKSGILAMKFGGTSVGSPEAMLQSAKIVREAGEDRQCVVVTSALSGVTDLLLKGASLAISGDIQTSQTLAEELRARHHQVTDSLISDKGLQSRVKDSIDSLIDNFENLCGAISVLGEATPRALDAVASIGERSSIHILAATLEELGVAAEAVEATELIVTDDNFQSAHPDLEATGKKTRDILLPLLEKGCVPVVTGFVAATPTGITTTLGRGGSDYSAAILATAVGADDVWIWTDVDGVMTTDPRIVPEAETIPALSYRELAELAYFGAKVVHPMTIRPVIEAGIGLCIRNTFNPNHPGTRLVSGNNGIEGTIKAVTAITGQRLITLEGRGMLGVPGVAARTFGAVAETGTNVILISQASSEQSICFAVPSDSVDQVLSALEKTFFTELENRDIDRVWASDETVIVTVVGSGMRHTPGVAGRVFSVLGNQEVNVVAIAQGSSEVSISLVLDASDMKLAVSTLHKLIHSVAG
jgi:aspartate kinase